MRSLVEGSTRRVWIRNEVTVNPRNFTIEYYYLTLLQSSSGHRIINVFFLPLLGYATRSITLVGYQNTRSLQDLRLVQRAIQADENPNSLRMIAVFASLPT